jgi:hypothetical protein
MSVRGPLTKEKLAFKSISAQSNAKKGTPLSIANQGVGITTTGASVQFEKQNVFSYPYGYKMGGYNTNTSRNDRIDFSNDTGNAVTRSSLTQGTQWAMGSASNQNFGYVMGGTDPFTSQIERLDYSNDTQNTTPVGNLSEAVYYGGATGNKDYAWYAFGIATPSYKTTVNRIDYSNDSATASPKGPLSGPARGWYQGMGNQNYGFFGGGYPAPSDSRIERIDYSNDTATAIQYGSMSLNGKHMYAAASNADYGWFMGGNSGGSRSSVERLDFSNGNSTVSPRGFLPRNTAYLIGTGSQSYGYTFGGLAPGTTSYINRVDYSNDTATALNRGVLTQNVSGYGAGAVSSQAFANPQTIKQINDFGAPYPVQRQAQRYAYFSFNTSFNTSIWRIDYSNDLHDYTVGAFLSVGAYSGATVSSETKGYFVQGAVSGASYSGMQRIDYSNETVSPTGGVLSAATYGTSGVGNKDYGYIAGLGQPPQSSRVERIDFSNDGANAVIKGPLARSNSNTTGVGNQDYGYVCGGVVSPGPINLSTVDRIDYSNDTATAAPKGNLSQTRWSSGATGNANYGWVAGGQIPGPTYYSTVDRIDYSNDTATAAPKGPLSATRSGMGAAGNKNYGYWSGGGAPPREYSERIDFANDTATALVRGGAIPSITTSPGQRGTSATANANPQL